MLLLDLVTIPLAELISIKHMGRVHDYIEAFELAFTQVNLPQGHVLGIFLAGLEKQTQMNVRMLTPLSWFIQLIKLARLFEASLPKKHSNSQRYK